MPAAVQRNAIAAFRHRFTLVFLYSGGAFTTIDPVNGRAFAHGINNNSQIVGFLNRDDGPGDHGSLETTVPTTPPPVGTTADMVLSGSNAAPTVASQYEIYDIGSNSILAAYSLGQVGTDWTF